MSTRRERAEKRRQWVMSANKRLGLVKRCPNCGEAGPHFVPPCFGDPGFYSCVRVDAAPKPPPPDDPRLRVEPL